MARTVRCPICKKEVEFNYPQMPFCSDRCRLLDLGNWASETYVIASPERGCDPRGGDARRTDIDDLEEADATEGSNR